MAQEADSEHSRPTVLCKQTRVQETPVRTKVLAAAKREADERPSSSLFATGGRPALAYSTIFDLKKSWIQGFLQSVRLNIQRIHISSNLQMQPLNEGPLSKYARPWY